MAGTLSAVAIASAMRLRADAKKGGCLFDCGRFGVPERFRTHPLFTTPHCGVNFGFLARRGYFSRPEVRRQPALIREAGLKLSAEGLAYSRHSINSIKTWCLLALKGYWVN